MGRRERSGEPRCGVGCNPPAHQLIVGAEQELHIELCIRPESDGLWPGAGVPGRLQLRLLLLRQKFDCLCFVIRARQQGHRGKLATRASINRRRMVAMELGM